VGITGIFRSPADRLRRALAAAAKPQADRDRAIAELRAAIARDAHAAAQAGAADVVLDAYRLFVDLCMQQSQGDQAFAALAELRRYEGGLPVAQELALKLANDVAASEHTLAAAADVLAEAGRLQELAPALRAALDDRYPRSVALAVRLGDALAAAGEFDEAVRRYRAAAELRPDEAPRLIPKLLAIVAGSGDSASARETLGLLLFRQREYAQAAEHLAQALALGDLEMAALFDLADAYLELRQADDAAEALERLLARSANEVELVRRCERLADLRPAAGHWACCRAQRIWGDALRRQSRFEEALARYRLALDDLPHDDAAQGFAAGLVQRLVDVAARVGPGAAADAQLELGRAYGLAGSFEQALGAYSAAVRADRSALPRAARGLEALVAMAPSSLSLCLQLAELQIALGDCDAALAALEAARRQQPAERGAIVEGYRRLLAALEGQGPDAALAADRPSVLAGTLYALAEELAAAKPVEAAACLARVLAALGAAQAGRVLEHLSTLDLSAQPALGHLIAGDAHRARNEFAASLAAYRQVPLDAQTVDEVIVRLERLAEADAGRPDALMTAATARLDSGALGAGIALLQRAFARDRVATAPVIVTRLAALRQVGSCPAAGLALLADALLHLGQPEALASGIAVARALLEAAPERATEVAAKAQALQEKLGRRSKGFAEAALLQGDALAAAGKPADAALAYAGAVGHAHADKARVIALLEALTRQAPQAATAWLVLGDAHQKQVKPATAAALAAYGRALEAGPAETAAVVLERLQGVKAKAKSDEALQARLLRAEALACLQDTSAAAELARILSDAGVRACDAIDRVARLLPEAPATWLLHAEVEAARGLPEQAASWLDRTVAQSAENDAERAREAAGRLAAAFPASAAPRLALARALQRLGRSAEAARVLGDAAEAFAAARAEAVALLEGLTQATPTSDTWLARARAYAAGDNVPAALAALAQAAHDAVALPAIQERLLEIAAAHPGRADVLQALVETETRLQTSAAAQQAVAHARAWLAAAPAEADQVAGALSQTVGVLEGLGAGEDRPLQEAYLAWADALLAAQQPDEAAQQLAAILNRWPEAGGSVAERCRQALATMPALTLRLALADACLACGDCDQAVGVCAAAPERDPAACQALAERCRAVLEATQAEQPTVAARAARAIAERRALQGDAVGAADACATAAGLDGTQAEPLAGWLFDRGWDAASRRLLRYAAAAVLRDAGEATFGQALEMYRTLLEPAFEAEAPQVLQALERFPQGYLAAWQMRLDLYVRLGPGHYGPLLEALQAVVDLFGPEQAGDLLAVCARMDPREPAAYYARARVHEATLALADAAAALLDLSAALPAELPAVERAFRGLLARHPDRHELLLSLGDAYRQAQQWDAALAVYAEAQQAGEALAAGLVERYAAVLAGMPESIPARWGLARAHLTLQQPGPAAQCLDELTDLDAGQAHDAGECVSRLLQTHATCGYGWYVHGKLAYRAGEHAPAIEHLEQALAEGDLPPHALALLYDMMGRAALACGHLDRALADLRQAAALSPDDAALRRALIAVRLALLDRAIAAAQEQLAAGADPVQARLSLAELLQQRGDYAQAVAILQDALPLAGQASPIHLALARCFAGQRRHHMAAASLEAALASDELDLEARKEVLYRLAEARRRQLRYDEAIAALEQVCALDATYQNVLGLLDIVQREKVTAQAQPATLRPTSSVRLLPEGR